jgi:hypothetical protein
MRTVIALDDELHRRAKAYAAKHGVTLAALVEESLLRSAGRHPMMAPDVNVLLYALREESERHDEFVDGSKRR